MRKILMGAVMLTALAMTTAAEARVRNSTVSGAAIGAGTGLLVAGPVGAVAGGVIGATVGGPTGRPHRRCWTRFDGRRQCRSYGW